ncbi:hypothetical protein BJ546DRAFT_404988 [Cryomyces antarcticus]
MLLAYLVPAKLAKTALQIARKVDEDNTMHTSSMSMRSIQVQRRKRGERVGEECEGMARARARATATPTFACEQNDRGTRRQIANRFKVRRKACAGTERSDFPLPFKLEARDPTKGHRNDCPTVTHHRLTRDCFCFTVRDLFHLHMHNAETRMLQVSAWASSARGCFRTCTGGNASQPCLKLMAFVVSRKVPHTHIPCLPEVRVTYKGCSQGCS